MTKASQTLKIKAKNLNIQLTRINKNGNRISKTKEQLEKDIKKKKSRRRSKRRKRRKSTKRDSWLPKLLYGRAGKGKCGYMKDNGVVSKGKLRYKNDGTTTCKLYGKTWDVYPPYPPSYGYIDVTLERD